MRLSRWPAFFLMAGCAGCGKPAAEAVNPTPTEVVVGQPSTTQITDYEEFTGHTDAIKSVQIRARVTGYLDRKDFVDGQDVKEGDVLYEIDDRPYLAALRSAEAMVAQAVAHKDRLAADYKRAANLFQRAAIGKQEFDLLSSNFAESEAQLGASKAQLETARLDVGFTKVRAPMAGQLSRTLVDPGNLVRRESTLLNDIVSTEELYAYFDISADAMERVNQVIQLGQVGGKDGKMVRVEVGTSLDSDRYEDGMKNLRDLTDGWLKRKADLEAKKKPRSEVDLAEAEDRRLLEAEEKKVPPEFPYQGEVNFSENKLDAATGTLRVRGVIKNPPPSILAPGLFVRVRLPIGDPHPALLVPEDSIGSDQGRSFVYVINAKDEVEYRPVVTGAVFSGEAGSKLRAIREGLKDGERFIKNSDAIRRVRPGAKVSPSTGEPAAVPPRLASR